MRYVISKDEKEKTTTYIISKNECSRVIRSSIIDLNFELSIMITIFPIIDFSRVELYFMCYKFGSAF